MKISAGRIGAPRPCPVSRVAQPHVGAVIAGLTVLAVVFGPGAAHSQTQLQVSAARAPSTMEYVRQSALTDLFEITASRVALEKSQSPAVRDFAWQLVTDHGRSTGAFKRALRDGNVMVTVPTALDPQHEHELEALQAKPADQFDRAYLESQLQGHRSALDMQRAYAQSGDNAALKKFAGEAAPLVQSHLAKLEVLAQQSFRGPGVPGPGGPGSGTGATR